MELQLDISMEVTNDIAVNLSPFSYSLSAVEVLGYLAG
jgi:hypothetical protein